MGNATRQLSPFLCCDAGLISHIGYVLLVVGAWTGMPHRPRARHVFKERASQVSRPPGGARIKSAHRCCVVAPAPGGAGVHCTSRSAFLLPTTAPPRLTNAQFSA
eukprot:scaffold275056_cov35-Tisochrysis_lutea.AAC.4